MMTVKFSWFGLASLLLLVGCGKHVEEVSLLLSRMAVSVLSCITNRGGSPKGSK